MFYQKIDSSCNGALINTLEHNRELVGAYLLDTLFPPPPPLPRPNIGGTGGLMVKTRAPNLVGSQGLSGHVSLSLLFNLSALEFTQLFLINGGVSPHTSYGGDVKSPVLGDLAQLGYGYSGPLLATIIVVNPKG